MIVNVLKLNYIIILSFLLDLNGRLFTYIHTHDELHAYINTYIAFFSVEIFIYSIYPYRYVWHYTIKPICVDWRLIE